MKRFTIILGVLLLLTIFFSVCSEKDESTRLSDNIEVTAVEKACLDYVEGYFESSGERIRRGVYKDLVKRTIKDNLLQSMTREKLIEYAEMKEREKPKIVVEIYDIHKNIALAKVTSKFVDYVQLAKMNDKWQVINVLWTY